MKIVLRFILLILVFCSCWKNSVPDPKRVYTCDCPDQSIKVDSNSVFGCWVLTDTGYVNASFPDTNWMPVDSARAVIKFNPDSSFCYDTNFPWGFAHYHQFTSDGHYMYLLPSEGNGWHTSILLTGKNELILMRVSIDYGPHGRYKRQ